jgi:hypothetical protein
MTNFKLLIISCIFGNTFKNVYHAPLKENCYFFSNNIDIKQEVENKGWVYFFIDFILSDDSIISSLQSKYIKFLIFLNDFPLFKKYQSILYFDHKVYIKTNHINKLLRYNEDIIIRKHESYRKNIWSEVEEASKQERYMKNMDKTIKFINDKINNNEISENVQICNTGLILYNNYNDTKPMLQDIYNTCINLEQPECQIIWPIFSQKYSNKIKIIDFNEIKPLWLDPYYYYYIINKIFIFFLTLFLIFLLKLMISKT